MNFNRINPVTPSFLIVNAFGKSQIPNESLPKASRYEAGASNKLVPLTAGKPGRPINHSAAAIP
jgi:hypothetical protein